MVEYKYRKACPFDLTLIVSIPNKDTPYIVRGRLTKIGLPFAIYRRFFDCNKKARRGFVGLGALECDRAIQWILVGQFFDHGNDLLLVSYILNH